MARFQERIYHDDTTEKRPLSQTDLSFLAELQKELNTQPNMGNADPLFWHIVQSAIMSAPEYDSDKAVITDDEGDIVAETLADLAQYVSDNCPDNDICCRVDPDGLAIISHGVSEEKAYCLSDAFEMLEDLGLRNLSLTHIRIGREIKADSLFLTHKDCEEHLEKYGYNYEPDAHAYAMTAIRSPRYENLLKIIRSVDWNALSQAMAKT